MRMKGPTWGTASTAAYLRLTAALFAEPGAFGAVCSGVRGARMRPDSHQRPPGAHAEGRAGHGQHDELRHPPRRCLRHQARLPRQNGRRQGVLPLPHPFVYCCAPCFASDRHSFLCWAMWSRHAYPWHALIIPVRLFYGKLKVALSVGRMFERFGGTPLSFPLSFPYPK